MSRDVYSEINLHITWHTKLNRPVITDAMERDLYSAIRKRIYDEGAWFREIGGTPDHVHFVVSIPPTLTISEFIGRLKGGSAHDINVMPQWPKALDWQSGYGVVSFGTKDMPWVIQYVRNQKVHHAKGTAVDRLERICQEIIAEARREKPVGNGLTENGGTPVDPR